MIITKAFFGKDPSDIERIYIKPYSLMVDTWANHSGPGVFESNKKAVAFSYGSINASSDTVTVTCRTMHKRIICYHDIYAVMGSGRKVNLIDFVLLGKNVQIDTSFNFGYTSLYGSVSGLSNCYVANGYYIKGEGQTPASGWHDATATADASHKTATILGYYDDGTADIKKGFFSYMSCGLQEISGSITDIYVNTKYKDIRVDGNSYPFTILNEWEDH